MKIKSLPALVSRYIAIIVCFSIIVTLSAPSYAAESDCNEKHRPPDGYTYLQTVKGNTNKEIFYLSIGMGACSIIFPGLSVELFISTTLYNALYTWNPSGEGRGDYERHIYYQKSSSGFWEHTLYYTTNVNTGEIVYLGCNTNRYWISNDA